MGLDAALIGLHHIWGTGRGWAGVRLPVQRQ
ncbi:TetR family transcriptional regulator [Mycobacteroides abscessus subsp. abscessus]|nr:TetR family transcriptional regulator [Mycobacteroides abscessus subsp. abscessus]